MAIRQKLFYFASGLGLSLLGALALRDELLVKTQRHLDELDLIEKDIRGEVYMRKEPEINEGLLWKIKSSYTRKWLQGITSTFKS